MIVREPDGRLRVFVSSTMDDLVNEREAVCRKLRELNFEPVNAENWLPDGQNSWDRICRKIGSSDLFVLLLGDRYGWIPEDGPKGGLGMSVTELELEEARRRQLTILPFAKELKYGSKSPTDDEKKRNDFRKDVFGWNAYFRGKQFRNCYELADLVGAAVVELISEHFQRARIEARVSQRTPDLDPGTPLLQMEPTELPADLVEAVRTGRVVMLAGAGISLAAGLPSASAFATRLVQAAAGVGTTLSTSVVGAAFTNLASEIELAHGRSFLVDAIRPLLDPPQGIAPTRAHRWALKLFRTIVTTNYDDLFERAAASAKDARPIVESEVVEGRLPEPVLVKFHGSFSRPETLVLSEREVLGLDRWRNNLWQSLLALLRERRLVVVGSSLHDASLVRLCLEAGDSLGGWFVAPGLSRTAPGRLAAWNLKTIDASADAFLGALTIAV